MVRRVLSERVYQFNPNILSTIQAKNNNTMADYKSYLAASILTEEKVVPYNPSIHLVTTTHLFLGHISTPQSHPQGPCQYCERVRHGVTMDDNSLISTRMLYDFHRQQNAKKPGAVHATYLVSGTKRKEEPAPPNGGVKKDGDDDYMQSSPFMSSSIPQPEEISTGETSVLTISLVREEELDGRDILGLRQQAEY